MRRLASFVSISGAIQIGGFALLAVIYFVWTSGRGLGDMWGDNTYYLLTAQYLSPWHEASAAAVHFGSNNPYPPLYPLLLGMTGGDTNLLVAHAVTTLCLLAALALMYGWLRAENASRPIASFAVVTFALLPGTYLQALSILSENFYLLFSLGAIGAVVKYESSRRETWLWTSALCVAAAVLTRSAGIVLLAAYFVYLVLHRPRRWPVLAAVALLPFLAWSVFRVTHDVSYTSMLRDKYGTDPFDALVLQLGAQIGSLFTGWAKNFSIHRVAVIPALMVAVCLAGAAVRVWQRKLDGLYVAFYLLLILVWPFPDEAARFLWVVVPILLVQALLLLRAVPRWRWGLGVDHLLLSICLLVALPGVVFTAQRFMQPLPNSNEDMRRDRAWYTGDLGAALEVVTSQDALIRGARDLGALVGDKECVYSIKPSIIGFYAGRVSYFPPREQLDAAAFHAELASHRCRYYFSMVFVSPTFKTPYYPLERLGQSLRVLRMTRVPGEKRAVTVVAELPDLSKAQ